MTRWQAIQAANAAGKGWVLNGITSGATDATVAPSDVEWIIANYLIVKGSHTYMNIYRAVGRLLRTSTTGPSSRCPSVLPREWPPTATGSRDARSVAASCM